jgi:type III secretory pathway component EscV
VEDTRLEADQIDTEKPDEIMNRIREIGINRIVGIFNRLSKVEDKIALCANELLNLVVGAGGARDMPVLLSYTLYKIALQIVKKSSEEHFIINDEGHPLPVRKKSLRFEDVECMRMNRK